MTRKESKAALKTFVIYTENNDIDIKLLAAQKLLKQIPGVKAVEVFNAGSGMPDLQVTVRPDAELSNKEVDALIGQMIIAIAQEGEVVVEPWDLSGVSPLQLKPR